MENRYFYMSFRFDKTKPQDFGLIPHPQAEGIYIDPKDQSQWIKRELYDFGWGNEYGFIRLPILEFEELWNILVYSNIKANRYGASYILETEYADKLMFFLINLLSNPDVQITQVIKEALNILQLDRVKNRSNIVGKFISEINTDLENWKRISVKVKTILCMHNKH